MRPACLVTVAAVLGAARPVAADAPPAPVDYFAAPAASTAVTVRRHGARTTRQRLAIAGLVAAAGVGVGVGAWFHLDSRDAADAVSADTGPIGEAWTERWQATYDRAAASGDKAIVGYAVGGALLGAALVVAWRTRPGDETTVLTPDAPRASVAPTPGGAILRWEGGW